MRREADSVEAGSDTPGIDAMRTLGLLDGPALPEPRPDRLEGMGLPELIDELAAINAGHDAEVEP